MIKPPALEFFKLMVSPWALKIYRLLVSVGLIVFLIHRLDLGEVANHLRFIAVVPLILAALLDFAMIGANSLRWSLLLRAKGMHFSQTRLLYFYLVGNFFSAFLPTSVGGDFVRVVGLSTDTDRRADVLASVVVERLLGFFVLLPMGLLAIPLVGRQLVDWKLMLTVWLLAGAIFVAAFVVLQRPVARRLSRVLDPLLGLFGRFKARERMGSAYEAIVTYGSCRWAISAGLALSVVSRLLWIGGCFLIGRAFSLNLSFAALLLIVPLVELARMIPISISGLGVREAAFVAMLRQFGVEDSLGFAYAVVVYVVFMLLALVGGLLYGTRQFMTRS
jgi:uncharacterized protein (TIRG00374 family)